jgi:hypothetical protein
MCGEQTVEKGIQTFVGKRLLRRPEYRCKDIKMDLNKTGWEGKDWIHIAQDIPLGSCEHSNPWFP